MKFLILILGLIASVGCAKSDGGGAPTVSNIPTPTPTPDPGLNCKPINSVWQSDSDQEKHDLRIITLDGGQIAYNFIAGDSEQCGGMTLELETAASGSSYSYTMRYRLDSGTAIVSCQAWLHTQNSTFKNGGANVTHDCTTLTMCRQSAPAACKTFH